MKKIFAAQTKNKRIVVYGANPFHADRNVAGYEHIVSLSHNFTKIGFIIPYCLLNEHGDIIQMPNLKMIQLPGRSYFSLITLIESLLTKLQAQKRGSQKAAVFNKLILEMNDLAIENSADFVVLLMRFSNEEKLKMIEFLNQHRIKHVDGTHPLQDDKQMQLSYDPHPNLKMNQYWADILQQQLPSLIATN